VTEKQFTETTSLINDLGAEPGLAQAGALVLIARLLFELTEEIKQLKKTD